MYTRNCADRQRTTQTGENSMSVTPRGRGLALALAAATMALSVTACAAETSSGGDRNASANSTIPATDTATLKQMATKVLNPDIDVDALAPEFQKVLMAGSVPLTEAQRAIFNDCMTKTTCETGQGTHTIALLSDLVHPYWSQARAEIVSYAIKSGEVAKITYSDSGDDVQRHMTNWRNAIGQGSDLLIPWWSTVGNQLGPVIDQAKSAGIPVVNSFVSLEPAVADKLTVEIKLDLCGMWESAASTLKQHLADKGVTDFTYAMFTGVPGNTYAPTWQPCAQEALDGAGFTKVYDGTTDWSPQGTIQAASALRASGRKPALIAYDESAADFINAYTAAGDRDIPTIMLTGSTTLGTLNTYQRAKTEGFEPDVFLPPSHAWINAVPVAVGLEIKNGGKPSSDTLEYPMGIVNASDIVAQSDLSLPDVACNGSLLESRDTVEALKN
ncbi:hypothetical protein EEB12_29270 [Rhodococcus sp. WS1]|nr:hypothetical protein EEB12_29270 [Rhodococcus sp. WS1]